MGETDRAATALEVSVSFGRFEHDDSLSWEKWSSFSPNKYLEEVGKYSTPGSVAQKKAYFEAHYKKIAAQKAEQSDQEKQISSPTTPSRDESEKKSHVKLTYVGDEEIEVSSNGRSGEDLDLDLEEGVEIESPLSRSDESSRIKDKTVKDSEFDVLLINGKTEEYLEQEIVNQEDTSINEVRQECSIMVAEENSNDASNYIESNQTSPQASIVEPSSKGVEKANGTLVKRNKIMKTPPVRDIARKISIPKKEPNPPETKKKVSSTTLKKSITHTKFSPESTPGLSKSTTHTKFSPESTPGLSKSTTHTKFSPESTPGLSKSITHTKFSPESTPGLSKSTIMPTKKTTKSSIPKSNFTSPGEHKRAMIPTTTSLHMSMSLDKGKPLPSSAITNRKSLIMEQMGDKDIVKRAFKTFQKQFNNGLTSSSNEKSKISDTDSDQKITRASIPRTENERLRRSVEKTNHRGEGGDLGNRSNHSSLVLHKGSGEEKKKKKPIYESLSTKLKSDAKLEKQQLKTSSSTQEHGKELPAAKTSIEKEANLKKSKQGLNFKATATTPPYNRATNIKTRIPSHKEEDNMKR